MLGLGLGLVQNSIAAAVAASSTIWNAATSSAHYTLSGGNLIATHSVIGADDLVRASNGHTTGDISFTIVSSSGGGNYFVGLANATEATGGNFCGATANSIGWFSGDGQVYRGGSIILSPATTYTIADVTLVRIKNGNLYLAKNGTYIGTMNPVAETGGIDVSTMGTLYPAASSNGGQVLTLDPTNWP